MQEDLSYTASLLPSTAFWAKPGPWVELWIAGFFTAIFIAVSESIKIKENNSLKLEEHNYRENWKLGLTPYCFEFTIATCKLVIFLVKCMDYSQGKKTALKWRIYWLTYEIGKLYKVPHKAQCCSYLHEKVLLFQDTRVSHSLACSDRRKRWPRFHRLYQNRSNINSPSLLWQCARSWHEFTGCLCDP